MDGQRRGPKRKFGNRGRTSVEWSLSLIQAVDDLRGQESLSVWTEKVLRRDPEIVAQLEAIGDSGFPAPLSRNEQLVSLMTAFYLPSAYPPHMQSELRKLLDAGRKAIMDEINASPQEVVESVIAAILKLWQRAKAQEGYPLALGTPEEALVAIGAYARFFYESIFLGACQGERAQLQHRSDRLLLACTAIYQHYHRERKEQKEMNQQLVNIANDAIQQARTEGLDEEDAKWQAQGALLHYGREQGIIGEELSPEMQAALAQVVKHVQE